MPALLGANGIRRQTDVRLLRRWLLGLRLATATSTASAEGPDGSPGPAFSAVLLSVGFFSLGFLSPSLRSWPRFPIVLPKAAGLSASAAAAPEALAESTAAVLRRPAPASLGEARRSCGVGSTGFAATTGGSTTALLQRRHFDRRSGNLGSGRGAGFFGLLPQQRRPVVLGRQDGHLARGDRARRSDVVLAANAPRCRRAALADAPSVLPALPAAMNALTVASSSSVRLASADPLPVIPALRADIDQLLVVDLQFFRKSVNADGQTGPLPSGMRLVVFTMIPVVRLVDRRSIFGGRWTAVIVGDRFAVAGDPVVRNIILRRRGVFWMLFRGLRLWGLRLCGLRLWGLCIGCHSPLAAAACTASASTASAAGAPASARSRRWRRSSAAALSASSALASACSTITWTCSAVRPPISIRASGSIIERSS